MENYIIEGTVTEISSDGTFKIAGSEGYAIKRGDKKYNVLGPADMVTDEQAKIGIILSQDFPFKADEKNRLIYHALGKQARISLSFEKNDEKKISEIKLLAQEKPNSVISITLIAN